ncbi:MAG: hypothetical protein Q8P18_34785 [Pseudomonadota bacterium]|nr:hypothetical protein [Pseudomonadota bacterium]
MLLVLLVACGGPLEPAAFTEADLAAEMIGYADWSHPDDWPGVQPSCEGSHGSYVQIWQNDVVDADRAAGGALSNGALFVAASYQDTAGTPKMFVSMRKVEGAPNTWFWGHYDEDAAPIDAGDLPACSACHVQGVDRVRHTGVVPPTHLAECRERDTGSFPG